jgi:restriction system protein
MARKSGFEEMVEAAALLPWYVSLVLACSSYLFLHAFSLESVPASPGQMDKIVLIGFSAALQYLVPLVFLCGALFSFLHSRRKRVIFDSQTSLHSIRALSWQEFEWLVSEAYRRKGYSVVERGGNAPDGGVDIELRKDGRKTIVQCKRWNAFKVNVSMVREAYGVMVAEGAEECIFVASGRYTRDAKLFAKGKPIQLIEGQDLLELIQGIKAPQLSTTALEPKVAAPTCPDCGSDMVSRIAGRGRLAGSRFWGCTRYPACLGKRSI